MQRPYVLGHRGSPGVFVENTLRSFSQALAEGADGIELDVRQCATGEVIVLHDPTLERLTRRPVRVAAVSRWALAQVPLGDGETVPTLADVFARVGRTIVNVEMKTDDGDARALAEATAAVIREHAGSARRVIVSSFDPEALVHLRAVAPEIDRGLLLEPDDLARSYAQSLWNAIAPRSVHPHHATCTDATVARWRDAGCEVFAWTADDPDDLARLVHAGVTGIIANRPGAALANLG